jgi:hypothetical protein
MAVGRETLARFLAPVYRGHHVNGRRTWHEAGERTCIALIVAGVVALALVATAAVLPPSSDGTSRLLPPLPARISPLPLAPVPRPQPSGPPGFPSAIPTADAPSPAQPPTASPTASPPNSPPVRPSVAPISYEAEAAANILSGEARIRDVAGASGGQVIGFIGGAPANALRFNRIVVPFGGVYTLAIHYISAEDRNATISVNDGRFVLLRFPATNDWETIGSLTLRIKLDSGINSIEFSNPVAHAPDIDRIIVGS